MWQTDFFVMLNQFCSFSLLTTKKIKIKKKMEKTPGDIIILHKCTINYHHMMYGSWDMKCDRQNFLSFWTIFCPFTLLTTWKIKILKNWKKRLEISFYTSVLKTMRYTIPEICNFYFSFWAIFCPFTPLTARKIKI